jgi:hypothetical protein
LLPVPPIAWTSVEVHHGQYQRDIPLDCVDQAVRKPVQLAAAYVLVLALPCMRIGNDPLTGGTCLDSKSEPQACTCRFIMGNGFIKLDLCNPRIGKEHPLCLQVSGENLVRRDRSEFTASPSRKSVLRLGGPGRFDVGIRRTQTRKDVIDQFQPLFRRQGPSLLPERFDTRVHGGLRWV